MRSRKYSLLVELRGEEEHRTNELNRELLLQEVLNRPPHVFTIQREQQKSREPLVATMELQLERISMWLI